MQTSGSTPGEPSSDQLEYAAGGRWRVWRHVNESLMAKRYKDPAVPLRDPTARGLWRKMRDADPDLPDFPEGLS